MFTGIIEDIGQIEKITKEQSNLILTISSKLVSELQINQSIAHNGVCLSVNNTSHSTYTVCVIQETLKATNISNLKKGDFINLERCLLANGRIDGHIVQGHVDCAVKCIDILDTEGSWIFTFECPQEKNKYLIPKGSIAINGVSLTIANINDSNKTFSVAIIPYTFKHTNFKNLKVLDLVNIEFDIIAKQIERLSN
tara:strand:- start:202 stop:789 length:588 start_codon:yes stop_codon:yes gene_type:complete